MNFIDRNLIAGESVIYRTRLHWVASVKPLVWSLVLDVVAVVLMIASLKRWLTPSADINTFVMLGGAVVLLLAMLVALRALWQRNATQMIVTNKRVLVKQGLLSNRSTEITLSKIESVVVEQSIFGRMLDYGTVVVRGVGGTPEPFAKIDRPLELRRQVQEQIEKISNAPHGGDKEVEK